MGLPVIAPVEFVGFLGTRDLAFVPAGEYSIRLAVDGRLAFGQLPDSQDIESPSSGRLSYYRHGNR
jgi:hypothetical protein